MFDRRPDQTPERSILHVDMDAFFASVEQLDDPSLRGRPVLVGFDGSRGVVAAASYEARVFGCHSAQPMAAAKRLCPCAAVVPVRHARYREASRRVFDVFNQFTPQVEPLSIDEAFLDVTGSMRLLGSPERIAADLKQTIRAATGLTASVGISFNKFLAKLASDMRKPDGLAVIRREDVDRLLTPMQVGKISGIGPRTVERLGRVGVRTIGDLRRLPADVLARCIGSGAEHFHRLALGIDDRPVVTDSQARSIGQEQTFGTNLADPESVRMVLLGQAEQVAQRLRRHALVARAISVKVRYGDYRTITRRSTFATPTNATSVVWPAARGLFNRWCEAGFQPVRLIGVSAGGLRAADDQLELFPDPAAQRQQRLDSTVDSINSRFGRSVIGRSGNQQSNRE
jgi:DNA polymerase-4